MAVAMTGWWTEFITQPTPAALTLTGATPVITISADKVVTPTGAVLTLIGSRPVLGETLYPNPVALPLTGGVPAVQIGTVLEPVAAALTIVAGTPTVTATDHKTVTPTGASLAIAGATPTITVSDNKMVAPSGATLSVTGGTPTVTVATPLAIIGTPNASLTTTVTIPAHQVGDLIVIFAYGANVNTACGKPTAAGTVPNWTMIDNGTGTNANASATGYFVATATNTTSGTWTNTNGMIAAVIRHQAASPIGGHAESGATSTNGSVAPAITMTKTDGTSLLLHFFGRRSSVGFGAWTTAPAGYTQQAATVSSIGVCLDTKNTTTSDGSVTQATDGGASIGYRGATVEILAP